MTFYVRRSRGSGVEGPFGMEQINQMVRQKRFTFKSLALADTGQGMQEVRKTPIKRWTKLADTRGFEPDPEEERNCLTIALVALIVFGLLAVLGLVKLKDILHRIH